MVRYMIEQADHSAYGRVVVPACAVLKLIKFIEITDIARSAIDSVFPDASASPTALDCPVPTSTLSSRLCTGFPGV